MKKHLFVLLLLFFTAVGTSFSQSGTINARLSLGSTANGKVTFTLDVMGDTNNTGFNLTSSDFYINYASTDVAFNPSLSSFSSSVRTGASEAYTGSSITDGGGVIGVSLLYNSGKTPMRASASGWITIATVGFDMSTYSGTTDFDLDDLNSFIFFQDGVGFSGMYATNNFTDLGSVALPVTLTSFNISKANETSTKLDWETASEENNRGFYVERSLDATDWQIVEFVETKAINGNSQQAIKYNFTDKDIYQPLRSRYNTFYYRLRQQDFNGTEEYVGGVKVIRFRSGDALSSQMELQPNPANNYVNITLTNAQPGASIARISDISGRVLLTQTFEMTTRIETSALKAGFYNIQVSSAGGEVIASEKLSIVR